MKEVSVSEILDLMKNLQKEDINIISRAFEFAKIAHANQKRFSGENYFIHPFETSKILAKLQLDAQTIAAGLLHDVCEDCLVTGEETKIDNKLIKKEFGEEIAFLVSGVTRLGEIKFKGEKEKVENLRKMFFAMAKDIRVILIKLADRLHNMRTLEYVPTEKQKRIALETLEIYGPLANRLGMGNIKGELEDLAFKYVYPEEYKKLIDLTKEKYEQKDKILAKIKYKLSEELKNNKIDFQVDSRIKHLYSLYKKLKRPEINMDINQIYDLIAIRVIVKNIEDCYKTLGIIHKIWKPLLGKIKDYIAMPKPNGYQSLHTTVFADGGNITEIQIRTEEMHKNAESGIAAHWAYTESGKPKTGGKIHPKLKWVNQLIEWQKNTSLSAKPKDFLETLKIDFFNDRVFCFTPKGDVIDLPEGATAIDFAYAVHAEIGNHAMGAIINNKFVSLDTTLKNGDIIEIKTQKNKRPSPEWLNHVKTSLAKKQIRSFLKREKIIARD